MLLMHMFSNAHDNHLDMGNQSLEFRNRNVTSIAIELPGFGALFTFGSSVKFIQKVIG